MTVQKKICCIAAADVQQEVRTLLDDIRSRIRLAIPILGKNNSVVDYEVAIFVLSGEAKQDECVNVLLKEASDLNKIFLPVILGGNWWKSWLLKRRYKGPDLRAPFFELRKEAQVIEFFRQIVGYSGSKICGDVYGSMFEFNVDSDCKVFRNNELIAETVNSHNIEIVLYPGVHKLVFRSIIYPELSEVVKIKVKNFNSEIKMDVKIVGGDTFTVKGVTFEMVYIEGGEFTIGETAEQEDDANDNEKPAHKVSLSNYAIEKFEVTQALWTAVMGSNPSYFKEDNRPVECVSWNDCQEFLQKLNELTGKNFRLPTEAEWEYAARGGNKSKGYKYSGSNDIDEVAWYDGDIGSQTHPVGKKKPNELGIYDMNGNVWEWCNDWYGDYTSTSANNPTGPSFGSCRVYRGGSWHSGARNCRVSIRGRSIPDYRDNHIGFRLVLPQ